MHLILLEQSNGFSAILFSILFGIVLPSTHSNFQSYRSRESSASSILVSLVRPSLSILDRGLCEGGQCEEGNTEGAKQKKGAMRRAIWKGLDREDENRV